MAKFYKSPFNLMCECGFNAFFHSQDKNDLEHDVVSCPNIKCRYYQKKYKIKKEAVDAERLDG